MIHNFFSFIFAVLQKSPEIALFLSLVLGYGIGRIKFGTFQLGGVAGSLLAALLISQVGISIDSGIKTVLFALFIYAVGYQSGPQFFRSLGKQSLKEIMMAVVLAATGLLTVVVIARSFHLDKGMAAGLAAGGLTQTAIIGTADSALEAMKLPLSQLHQLQGNVVVGYAITYIFGTIGTIIMCCNVLPWLMKQGIRDDAIKAEAAQMGGVSFSGKDEISAMPDLVGRAYQITHSDLTVSKIETMAKGVTVEKLIRHRKAIGVGPDVALSPGDTVLLFGHRDSLVPVGEKIGKEVTHGPELDVVFQRTNVVVTSQELLGKTVSQCAQSLSSHFVHGVYLVGVSRGGKSISFNADTCCQLGDIVTLFGTSSDVQRVAQQIGKILNPGTKTDMIYHAAGLVVGLLIGLVVVHIGAVSLTLGSGGGALFSGLLFGWYQNRHPAIGNMPMGASNLLKDLGLAGFVAVTGLQTGQQAITSIAHHGVLLFCLGMLVTLVPLILTLLFGRYILRYKNSAVFAGALAGSRSANPAFGEVLNKAGNSVPTTPFALTYAISNILLTLLGPLVVAFA